MLRFHLILFSLFVSIIKLFWLLFFQLSRVFSDDQLLFLSLAQDFIVISKVQSQIWGTWNSFKNDGKCFLFHLKSSFWSQDIFFFFSVFVMYKNGLIWKIRLITKFMLSQSGWPTIAIHILTNISRSKGNQEIKFIQLIYITWEHFSWKMIYKM